MQLIWHRHGEVRRLRLGHPLFWLTGLGLLLLVAITPYWDTSNSFLSAWRIDRERVGTDAGVRPSDAARVEDLLITTEAQMTALAAKLGELQGRLTRLESIGQQVGKLVGIESERLTLDGPVAIGGPEEPVDDITLPELLVELREFSARVEDREVRFELLEQSVLIDQIAAQRQPSGRPTRSGWLSSAFGYRTHPISGKRHFHAGVDLAGVMNDPVEAVASGLVTWSGPRSGYGNLVEIDHRNGFVTRYGHNAENLVSVGDLVKQGQVVARMGSTGRSTGPHVHFETLKNGKPVNPRKFLRRPRIAQLSD